MQPHPIEMLESRPYLAVTAFFLSGVGVLNVATSSSSAAAATTSSMAGQGTTS